MSVVTRLRQLLGLDRESEYTTISAPITLLILVSAFAASVAATRVVGASDAIGVLVMAVAFAAGLWLAARSGSERP